MKLLYVCGTYAPGAFAGSELSAHELLRGLATRHGVEVLVVTDKRYTGGSPGRGAYQGVPVCGIDHERRRKEITRIVNEFRPNAIFTQLLWSDVAMEIGRDLGLPTIFRLVSFPTKSDLSLPTVILTNAKVTSDWVRTNWGRDSECILSTIDFARVVAPQAERNPRYITMFNPIDVKGGGLFRKIASAMPKRQFAVVPGWHSLRSSDGAWDRTTLRRSYESQGMDLDWAPQDIDFSGVPNVTILPPRQNVAEIYAQTRILLVPSQWQETLGRVSIEAFANGIPVIASAVGGLQDHVGAAGILVREIFNVNAWVRAIQSLDDPQRYNLYSERGKEFAHTIYSADRTLEDFLALLERICNR